MWEQIQKNPHTSLKNQVFYRQDYLDEFEKIWSTQAQFYPDILTNNLKKEIRDTVIFYQRKLKSQKGLIGFCEFESKEIEIVKEDGKLVKKLIGSRVAPRSSPLFQEFKIWQNLHNVTVRKKDSRKRKALETAQELFVDEDKEIFILSLEQKQLLFDELNLKGNLSSSKILELLGLSSKEWELNYKQIEGNKTNRQLYDAYLKIIDLSGHSISDYVKVKSTKSDIQLDDLNIPSLEIKNIVKQIFEAINISTDILEFNAELS